MRGTLIIFFWNQLCIRNIDAYEYRMLLADYGTLEISCKFVCFCVRLVTQAEKRLSRGDELCERKPIKV